ncbi:hypothetical protein NQ317_013512 [Molorchus minor]|uniref:Fatty acyl-CoA reductase n=1 Tax=Molorchus minor TaxID=1323400 RepID=A0ABQ9JV58_9CUCU|nr:hypothetical protein NQ317_013512 [Molorchus minor]
MYFFDLFKRPPDAKKGVRAWANGFQVYQRALYGLCGKNRLQIVCRPVHHLNIKKEQFVQRLFSKELTKLFIVKRHVGTTTVDSIHPQHPGDNNGIKKLGLTPIQEFYVNANVFITGSTGFLGRILVEKLLRSCPGISTVYLLVRNKKGKNLHARLDEVFDDVIYDTLKKECPKFRHKVVGIAGDCSLPGLGLSEQDRNVLIQEVNVVFHVAATVRFDEKLQMAVAINVRATQDILRLANQMKHLKAVMHVSTAFSNCLFQSERPIEERIYPAPLDYRKLIGITENLHDKILDNITPMMLDQYPNTYAYTKQIAEDVVKNEGLGLPIGILRPSIVVSTYKEPIRAWINNMYGATGVAAGAGLGLLRSLHCDPQCNANVVPVDMCVNFLIAAAWDVENQFVKSKKEATEFEIPVYNYESSNDKPITWKDFMAKSKMYGMCLPSIRAVWMMKIYSKIHKFSAVLSYFSVRQWKFGSYNVNKAIDKMTDKDKEIFFSDLRRLNWDEFFQMYLRGVRVYLIQDSMDTLIEARRKWNRLYWAHQIIKAVVGFLLMRILWSLFSFIYSTVF